MCRTTAATLLNERSSRSHSILVLKVVRHCTGTPGKVLTGHIYIVDLAGSEDNRRTGNIGVRFVLDLCVMALEFHCNLFLVVQLQCAYMQFS